MNLYVILITYTVSVDEINKVVDSHREYLKQWYLSGNLLASGPREPKVGGIIIGRFDSLESAIDFTKCDPYRKNGVANYEVLEFNPVLHSEVLNNFINQ